ncbi:MAG: DNA-binding response regulator [Gammaproteobacteria bacterium]|nr:MAG: DNA-binding response regulator [Gammaproteobacteria bacterium]
MKILIIEDDHEVAENLDKGLTEQGFIVDCVHDGISGLQQARQGNYHVLVVDRMLPGLDGLSLLRQLREQHNHTPALMLTALSEVDDKIEGFEAGADDYLSKPFAFAELVARLRALAKRNASNEALTQVHVCDLVLNKVSRDVSRGGQEISLKPREFELLLYFCEHVGEPVTRDMLLKDVWGLAFDPQTNIVDVHISRLRQKIDKDFRDPLIRTVRGVGYIFGAE